jgi:superfamily I DNA/RNA helicase
MQPEQHFGRGLSEEQKKILQPGSLLVQACPGSGKTRAIVSRYIQRAAASKKGVALLSFTNRAVDEVRARCADYPHLLLSPNFVGTFDAFLHNFVVTPYVLKTHRIVPTYLRSWKDLDSGDHWVRLNSGPAGSGVCLSSFLWTEDGNLRPQSLSSMESVYFSWVEEHNRREIFLDVARNKLKSYIVKGILDSNAARYIAHQVLTMEGDNGLLRRLAMRFHEVVVDEFQDCDEHEHVILDLLAGAGINIVVVADPDQSIFEFRGARPDLVATYAQRLGRAKTIAFNTNYRSTAAICSIATSLRAVVRANILPSGSPPPGPDEVQVLFGSVDEQRNSFIGLLNKYDIPLYDSLVLAYARRDAMNLSGSASASDPGSARGNRIAIAAAILAQRGQSLASRKEALHDVERIVLSLFDWPVELANNDRHKKLSHLGETPAWLRAVAVRMVKAAWNTGSREKFGENIRKLVEVELRGYNTQTVILSANIKAPPQAIWEQLTQTATTSTTSLPFDTVHNAKGSERKAILLYIPPRRQHQSSGLEDWFADRDSAARRVLYVGATRAQSLLALAVATSSLEQTTTILERDNVPYTLIGERAQSGPGTRVR